MTLRDAMGENCKKEELLKLTAEVSSVWMDDCVCYLAWHDNPSLVEGESHGILYKNKELAFSLHKSLVRPYFEYAVQL